MSTLLRVDKSQVWSTPKASAPSSTHASLLAVCVSMEGDFLFMCRQHTPRASHSRGSALGTLQPPLRLVAYVQERCAGMPGGRLLQASLCHWTRVPPSAELSPSLGEGGIGAAWTLVPQ